MNTYLKVSAIINFIIGGLFTLTGLTDDAVFLSVYGLIELGFGTYFYFLSKEDIQTLYEHRGWLLLCGILNFIPSFLSSIFVFIAYDQINIAYKKIKKKKKKIHKNEKKKLDLLLKVGAGLIISSGVILMSTSFSIWIDLLTFAFFTVVFFGLYFFSENYLHNKKSSWVYHLLSMFFLFLTIGNLQEATLTNHWFGFSYVIEYIFEIALFLLFAFISYRSYRKFDTKIYLYSFFTSLFLALGSFLDALSIPYFLSLTCVNLIVLLVSMLTFKKQEDEKCFRGFLLLVTYVLAIAYIGADEMNDMIMCIFSSVLTLGNMYLLTIPRKDVWSSITTTIVSIPLLPCMVMFLQIPMHTQIWVLMLSYCLLFGLLLLYKDSIKNVLFHTLTTIVLNLSLFGVYLYSYQVGVAAALMVSFALLFVHFMYLTIYDTKKTIEYYLQPAKTALLAFTCLMILKPSFSLDDTLMFGIVSMILLLINHLKLEKELKWSYFVTYFIFFIYDFLISLGTTYMMGRLLLILLSIYTAYFTYHHKDARIKNLYPLTYGWCFLIIYELISIQNMFHFPTLLNDLIVILSFLVGAISNYENKKMFGASLVALILPMYHLISFYFGEAVVQLLGGNLLVILAILWFNEKAIKSEKDRRIFAPIMVSVSLLYVFFSPLLLVGIYVGLVTILLMMYSKYQKDYPILYKTSLVLFIINLCFHLPAFLSWIPLWSYLMIAGLGVIGFVTYKEMIERKGK